MFNTAMELKPIVTVSDIRDPCVYTYLRRNDKTFYEIEDSPFGEDPSPSVKILNKEEYEQRIKTILSLI